MGNFECDTYVEQLKDVDCIVTSVGGNKLHVFLYISLIWGNYFYNFAVVFYFFITSLSLFCTADGSCELLRYIATDLSDYTVS